MVLQYTFFFFWLHRVGLRMAKRGSEPGSPFRLVSAVEPALPGLRSGFSTWAMAALLQEAKRARPGCYCPPVSRVRKSRQSVAFRLKGCVGGFQSLSSQKAWHRAWA